MTTGELSEMFLGTPKTKKQEEDELVQRKNIYI
jgi:hypothetical protein